LAYDVMRVMRCCESYNKQYKLLIN